MTTYVLRPAPPLRSYLVAAILAALGALMVVGSGLGKNLWLLVFGALVLADGLVLVLMTTISAYRARVAVDLDENGYVIHSREGDVHGTWDQITRVTRSADGTQLVFHHGEEQRLVLIGREVTRLESNVARYLDKNRGYGSESASSRSAYEARLAQAVAGADRERQADEEAQHQDQHGTRDPLAHRDDVRT